MMNILFDLLSAAAVAASSWIGQLVSYSNEMINGLYNNRAVVGYLIFISVFGSIMYLFGVGFSFADWALKHNENISVSIMDTFKNQLIGLFALLGFTQIPVLLIQFTNDICIRLISGLDASAITNLMQSVQSGGLQLDAFWTTVALPVFVIIMFVCVVKLFFSNIKRGGILLILISICPVHLFSLTRGYCDSFYSWCRQVLALCLTAFVQNFLIALSLVIFAFDGTSLTDIIIAVGVALSAAEAPRILQQFGLDTSMRANLSQAIFGVSGVMNIIKMM